MKRRTIITSILVIVLCLGLISGSTFALFTSTSSVNIAVTSGKVDVKASLSNPVLFSANANITTGDKAVKTTDTSTSSADGTLTGTFAGTYYYQPQTGTFLNGGTANYEAPTLTIDKMTPGDKVKTTLSLTNDSNVDIQYRLRIDANENSNEDLLSVIKLEFNGKLYTGLSKFTSAWTKVSTTDSIETKDISIIFPLDIDGQKYMEKTVSLVILVEAVQGNANTSGDEEVETIIGKITNYAPATAQLSQGTQDTGVDYVKTTQNVNVEIESNDIVATSIIPGDTVFFMDKPGNTDYIPLGQTAGDGSLSRLISTTATSETSAVIDISYKYTDSDGITTDVTGFSNIVTNIVNVGPGLLNVSVTRTHNGTTVTMTKGFDPTTGEGFSYDVSSGVLTIKSKLYSDYNMTFVTPVAKVVSDSTTTYYETVEDAFEAAQDEDTIVLLKDTDVTEEIEIDSIELTFDLNKKTLTDKVNESFLFQLINNGTLEINGSDGKIIISEETEKPEGLFKIINANLIVNGGTYSGNTVEGSIVYIYGDGDNETYEGGVVELNNVTSTTNHYNIFTGTTDFIDVTINGGNYTSGNKAFYIDCYDYTKENSLVTFTNVKARSNNNFTLQTSGAYTILNNCEFTEVGTLQDDEQYLVTVSTSYDGVIEINGGTYTSDMYTAAVYNSGGTITINEGTFTSPKALYVSNGSTSRIYVNGGDFYYTSDEAFFDGGAGDLTQIVVNGLVNNELNTATFSSSLSGTVVIIEDGYTSVENSNGRYSIDLMPVAKIGNVNYQSLQSALDAVDEGQTVLLCQNISISTGLTFNKNVTATLDLGNHKISNANSNITTILSIQSGNLSVKNGSIENVNENQTTTIYAISVGNNANASELVNLNIRITGTGLLVNGHVGTINSNIYAYVDCNGYCTNDCVYLAENGIIDLISGGDFISSMTQAYLESIRTGTKTYNASHPLRIEGALTKISGGTFLSYHPSVNYANFVNYTGSIGEISGGYFGFNDWVISGPCRIFTEWDRIGKITGGTFESGGANQVFDLAIGAQSAGFRSAVERGNASLTDSGETSTSSCYWSTSVSDYTGKIYIVTVN